MLQQGTIDPITGRVVQDLISDMDYYQVYLDQDLRVWWTVDYDLFQPPVEYTRVATRLIQIQGDPAVASLSKIKKLSFATMLATAMQQCLASEGEERCSATLEAAQKFVIARSQEVARCWHLLGSFLVMIISVVWYSISVVCWGVEDPLLTVITVTTCGAIGAFFSVAARLGSFDLAPSAGFWIHFVESISRVVVGVIGALIVYLAIRGKMMLNLDAVGPQAEAEHWYGLLTLAIVGGASEYFVPNFINRMEARPTSPPPTGQGNDRTVPPTPSSTSSSSALRPSTMRLSPSNGVSESVPMSSSSSSGVSESSSSSSH
ncbi:MAG: hypothetical protein JWM11_3001 [Planctomycetaceae bacterium]|nr:hypothetical protein [Planctomycetaceae bacterium]